MRTIKILSVLAVSMLNIGHISAAKDKPQALLCGGPQTSLIGSNGHDFDAATLNCVVGGSSCYTNLALFRARITTVPAVMTGNLIHERMSNFIEDYPLKKCVALHAPDNLGHVSAVAWSGQKQELIFLDAPKGNLSLFSLRSEINSHRLLRRNIEATDLVILDVKAATDGGYVLRSKDSLIHYSGDSPEIFEEIDLTSQIARSSIIDWEINGDQLLAYGSINHRKSKTGETDYDLGVFSARIINKSGNSRTLDAARPLTVLPVTSPFRLFYVLNYNTLARTDDGFVFIDYDQEPKLVIFERGEIRRLPMPQDFSRLERMEIDLSGMGGMNKAEEDLLDQSIPVGIYYESDHLYLVGRLARNKGGVWRIYAIETKDGKVVGVTNLSTDSWFVSLLDAGDDWLVLEQGQATNRTLSGMLRIDKALLRLGGKTLGREMPGECWDPTIINSPRKTGP